MSKTRDIYIGNGETVRVATSENGRYYLDLYKLKDIVDKSNGRRVTVGATGDWFFTAQDVSNGNLEDIRALRKNILRSSDWSRFHAEVDDEVIDLTVEIPIKFARLAFEDGMSRGINVVELWLNRVYTMAIRRMNYEEREKMREELAPILDKYINMCEDREDIK